MPGELDEVPVVETEEVGSPQIDPKQLHDYLEGLPLDVQYLISALQDRYEFQLKQANFELAKKDAQLRALVLQTREQVDQIAAAVSQNGNREQRRAAARKTPAAKAPAKRRK